MADVVVSGDDESGDDLEVQAVHEAAVAEGAAQVHEEEAAEHAEQAEAAAELAVAAAEANAEVVAEITQSAAQAEMAAADAGYSRDAVVEALSAQTTAINTLVEELRASRKSAEPPKEKPKSSADKAPAAKKSFGHRYYGR